MPGIALRLKPTLVRALSEEEGQGLVEYALLFLLVVIVAIVALTFLGHQVTTELTTIATSVSGAVGS